MLASLTVSPSLVEGRCAAAVCDEAFGAVLKKVNLRQDTIRGLSDYRAHRENETFFVGHFDRYGTWARSQPRFLVPVFQSVGHRAAIPRLCSCGDTGIQKQFLLIQTEHFDDVLPPNMMGLLPKVIAPLSGDL
jgi:hypothetical protein